MASKTKSELPKPDERGHYKLTDGSVVYRAGKDYDRDGVHVKMPDAGKYMLWRFTGYEVVNGQRHARGEFVMTRDSIRYFDTPAEAVRALEE